MFWKISLVFFLVAANGFFVAAEFALVKLRLQEIKLLARKGSKAAQVLESIMVHLDAYLSACQLGITLASLGLGWLGEPLVATMIEPIFRSMEVPTDQVHFVAFPIAFLIITTLHITAGEQVPKILAIQRYKSTALTVAIPLALFYRIFQPLIWVVNTISNLILRTLGIEVVSDHSAVHTEEEVRAILLESAAGGYLTRRERLIIENVLDLENKIARRYMLPRNEIVYLNKNDSMEEKLRKASESDHTRLPLCDGDLDHVIGIVHVKDVFRSLAKKERLVTLIDLARKPTFRPETVALDILLKDFQKNHTILTFLVDEYGVVSGMITLENVIEQLVGPIQDEFDQEKPSIEEKGQNRFQIDAACLVDDVIDQLKIELPETDANTIGGMVVEQIGRIPAKEEKVMLGDHEVTVLEAEPTRIRMVLLKRAQIKED
ncbi:MAG TPA: hemolysin family protein [Acidobacteriota bacterium]|nr:hemolysin family protein [Acidobacteriota bacterium]